MLGIPYCWSSFHCFVAQGFCLPRNSGASCLYDHINVASSQSSPLCLSAFQSILLSLELTHLCNDLKPCFYRRPPSWIADCGLNKPKSFQWSLTCAFVVPSQETTSSTNSLAWKKSQISAFFTLFTQSSVNLISKYLLMLLFILHADLHHCNPGPLHFSQNNYRSTSNADNVKLFSELWVLPGLMAEGEREAEQPVLSSSSLFQASMPLLSEVSNKISFEN